MSSETRRGEIAVHDLIFPPRTEMLGLIRPVVTAVARELGFASREVHRIEMAVDEACANVIRHAYDETDASRLGRPMIWLQVRAAPDRLTLRVIDHGCGLPPDGAQGVSSVEEYAAREQPHGLGTYIIDQFMDEVAYASPAECGTVLSMVKYLRSSAAT